MDNTDASQEPTVTSFAKAPATTITAEGVTYAYRELGPKGGIPVVFFVHLAATLDNWDPRIIDPIAKNRHVPRQWPMMPTLSSRLSGSTRLMYFPSH
jgi:hypothetical protein